ncbi:MAG: hypothetical protein HN940_02595 [Planctomycetes bacterium]|nr:hypothetical protein [Planctomycetota bacterium]
MTANRLLALVGTSTMMLEILLARQLGKILGSALDGVALAVTVALAGFAIGQIFSASVKERRSVPATWCRIALLGCVASVVWVGYLLPMLIEGFELVSTTLGKIVVSLPLLCASIPLGAAVTTAFRTHSSEVLHRSSSGVAAIDLGSALGAIVTPVLLLPLLGVHGTLVMSLLLLGLASLPSEPVTPTESELIREDRRVSKRATLMATWVGCISLALQLGWVRVLGEVLGSSLLVFGISTGVSLLGAAAGALLMPEMRKKFGEARFLRVAWSSWLISQGLSLLLISWSPYFYLAAIRWVGENQGVTLVVIKSLLLMGILGLPSFCCGLILPSLMVSHGQVGRLDRGAGYLQGFNLLGSMIGASMAAFWIIPQYGPLWLFGACGFATLVGGLPMLRSGHGGAASSYLCGALLLASASQFWDASLLGAGVFQWSRSEIIEGTALSAWKNREILTSVQGRLGTVQIERDLLQNTSYLRVGGRIEGSVAIDSSAPSMADLPTEVLLGLLPSWVGPGQGDLFIVGLGGGTTVASAASTWTGKIVVSEIEPAVKDVLLSSAGEVAFPIEHWALRGKNSPSIRIQDARALLARDPRLWNAIVIQPSEPWLPWSAPLFAPDFHRLLSRRITADGVVIQWLQLYRIGIQEFAGILSSFRKALGPVQIWRPPGTGEVILVAGNPTSTATRDVSEAIDEVWQRVGSSVAFPQQPWLDDRAVEYWLTQAGGGDLPHLRERLEHRLPLLGESGVDHSRTLLQMLEEARQAILERLNK